MGIKKFYSGLRINGVTKTAIITNFIGKDHVDMLDIDHFLIDANAVIYTVSNIVCKTINSVFYYLLVNIFKKTDDDKTEFLENNLTDKQVIEFITKFKIKDEISNCKSLIELINIFHNKFNFLYMQRLVISESIKEMASMVTDNSNDKLKTILIAFDGLPPKAKMGQQKTRRYTNAIEEIVHSLILQDDYEKKIISKLNYLFEKQKIKFGTGQIAPGTGFMERLSKKLNSDSAFDLFTKNTDKIKLIISDSSEIGEGEKKIMNYIKKYHKNSNDNILVHSPDADVILLCILAPIENVLMLRPNQQTSQDDMINIRELKENIFTFCSNYINKKIKKNLDNKSFNRICYDIAILSTIFGNDFLPKIETIDVDNNFEGMIISYSDTLIKQNENILKNNKNETVMFTDYLLKRVNKKYTLNFTLLKDLLRKLLPVEKDRIVNDEFYNKYSKAGLLKYVFEGSEYLSNETDLNIKNVEKVFKEFITTYNSLKMSIDQNKPLHEFIKNKKFMEALAKSINIVINGVVYDTLSVSNEKLIKLIKKHKKYNKNKRYPDLKINLFTYSHSISQGFYKKEIVRKKKLKYEITLLQFDELLDEWYSGLDVKPINWKTYSEEYLENDPDKISKKYIIGLFWMVEQYCNETNYLNNWTYIYKKSPLLKHLYNYLIKLDESEFYELVNKLDKYRINNNEIPKNYFNPLSQFIYVSAPTQDNLNNLPTIYKQFINENEKELIEMNVHFDYKNIAKNIFNKNLINKDQTYIADFTGCKHFRDVIFTDLKLPSIKTDLKYFKMIKNVNNIEKEKMDILKNEKDVIDKVANRSRIKIPLF